MMAETVSAVHVAEEEVTLSSPSNVNALEEEKRDVREHLFNGANGNIVTEEVDGGGDTDDSYDFINENDALNGDSEDVDLDKNSNGVAEEDQVAENLEIKGEVKSESSSIKGLEGEDGSCGKEKESIELCHVDGPVVEEKPWDLVENEEHGVSDTSGANQEGVNVLDSTSEKHTDVNSDGGDLESTDKTSSIIISNGDSTNDSDEHAGITVDSNGLVEFPVASNCGSSNDSLKKEEHAEVAVDDEERAEMAAVDDGGTNGLVELLDISNGGSTNDGLKKEEYAEVAVDGEEHAEMAVDGEEHAEMVAVDDGGSNGLVDLMEGVSDIIGDDDIVKVSKAVVDSNYSIQQNSDELSSGVSDINGDKDNVTITVSEAAVDPESAFKVDNTSNEVCSASDFVSNGLKDSVSIPVSNEFHQDSDIVVVDEDTRSKKNDDSDMTLSDVGYSATRVETEFVKTDDKSRGLDEEVDEIETSEAFCLEEVVKNSESLVGNVENPETLIKEKVFENSESLSEKDLAEEDVAKNSEALAEENVAENSEALIENEVVHIGNPESVIDQDVEVDFDIENSKGILQKEVDVTDIGNPDTLVREEIFKNSESLVEENAAENSESLVEENVAENSEALIEMEVAGIGNPESVVNQNVEVEVTDIGNPESIANQDVEVEVAEIGNSKGILEKEVEVVGIGNCEGILKKEVEVADPENLEPAKEAAVNENLEAADIDYSEPSTAIAGNGNLNREETAKNPETDVMVDIVNPEEASTIDNDSGACSIQFGSIGEPVDEVVVSKSPFRFLIRIPRCDDESLKEKIRLAQVRVNEKTQSRDAIRIEMQAKRATCKDYGDNFEAAKSQERAARDLLKSKRQEIDSVQSVINIEDIDGRIRNMEHMIQHETMPLKEEKQIIREIKQLKQVREQLSSTMGRNDEVQQGSDQKEQIEKQMKSLKKEVDQLRVELLKAEAVTKAAKKRYYDETEKLNKLLSQFKAADDIRQEAYSELQSLKKQSYEKNKYFWLYRDDAKKANDLSLQGDKEAVQNLCLNQVERFMDLWNNNDEFRKEYVRCNIRSTLRRLRTLDGRALGPDEQPPVIPQAASEGVGKDHGVHSERQTQEKVVPVNVVKSPLDERIQEKLVLAKVVKSVAAPATPSKDEIEEVREEKPKKSDEEEELARKAEKLRMEEEAIKLREQRRLEEIVKAKEAQERKKRMAEKAQARAAQRAQKEAEQKEKEREKKIRKKERRKLAATEAVPSDVAVNSTDSTSETQPAEIAKESENNDKPVTVAKRTTKASQFTKAKSIPPPPLRYRAKRRMQPWMWVLLTTLIMFSLFLIGNINLFNLGKQRFNF